MKLVMTLLVRDEEDILATHIEYHLARGVDFFLVTDNRSVDSTPDILRRYEKRGVLRAIYEGSDDYSQDLWVTRMARMAHHDHGADWVIHSDADELWWPEREDSLKDVLRTVRPGFEGLVVQRFNFSPVPETEHAYFVDTMTAREVRSFNSLGHPLPPKVCHRSFADVRVAQGNHHVTRDGDAFGAHDTDEVWIMHFPLRTYRQFANKIANGGAAYERNRRLAPDVGLTWRRLYEQYRRGGLEDYYRRQVLDRAARRQGRAEGTLVRETRLKDFVDRRLDRARIAPR